MAAWSSIVNAIHVSTIRLGQMNAYFASGGGPPLIDALVQADDVDAVDADLRWLTGDSNV